jgi:hypothetical protein
MSTPLEEMKDEVNELRRAISELRTELDGLKQGRKTFKRVKCRELVLQDRAGEVRMHAYVWKNGDAGIVWFDRLGRARISAITSPPPKSDGKDLEAASEASISLMVSEGRERLKLFTHAFPSEPWLNAHHGDAGLHILDRNGTVRIDAGTMESSEFEAGTARVAWFGPTGKARIVASTSPAGVKLPDRVL